MPFLSATENVCTCVCVCMYAGWLLSITASFCLPYVSVRKWKSQSLFVFPSFFSPPSPSFFMSSIYISFCSKHADLCAFIRSRLIPHLFTKDTYSRWPLKEKGRDDLMRRTGWQLRDGGWIWEEMVWFQCVYVCVCECYEAYFYSLTFSCQTPTVPFYLTRPSWDIERAIC